MRGAWLATEVRGAWVAGGGWWVVGDGWLVALLLPLLLPPLPPPLPLPPLMVVAVPRARTYQNK